MNSAAIRRSSLEVPSRRHLGPAKALLFALLATASWAESSGGLGLEDVVRATLSSSPEIRIAESLVRNAAGSLLLSRSAFDPNFLTQLSSLDLETPQLGAAGPDLVSSQRSDFEVGWQQQLRIGAFLEPGVSLRRTPGRVFGLDEAVEEAAASLRVVVPLRKDFRAVIQRNAEQAAELVHRGQSFDLEHERSLRLSLAVAGYWSYLAAQKRIQVFTLAEEFAAQLVEETRQLVDAEERPTSDLNQVQANHATRRIGRLQEERQLIDARTALGLSMGLSSNEISTIPAAVDAFPEVEPFTVIEARIASLRDLAFLRRTDLQAVADREQASELLLAAAENDLRPSLDLSTELTYATLSAADATLPFAHGNVDGLSATIALRHELPVRNRAARGQLMSRQSDHTVQQILRSDLRRRIGAGLERAARDLEREVLSAVAAAEAVKYSQITVDNERKKNRLGVATLFDVILAQDLLISAKVNEVNARLRHALAILELRFETGTLITDGNYEVTIGTAPLLTAP